LFLTSNRLITAALGYVCSWQFAASYLPRDLELSQQTLSGGNYLRSAHPTRLASKRNCDAQK
jgi:hypothetical protein